MTEIDAAGRVSAYLDLWDSTDYTREMDDVAGGFSDFPALTVADLRALVAELERLRAERGDTAPQPTPALGNAYANGWYDALAALHTPGWDEREAGWRKFIAAVEAHTPQRPERGGEVTAGGSVTMEFYGTPNSVQDAEGRAARATQVATELAAELRKRQR